MKDIKTIFPDVCEKLRRNRRGYKPIKCVTLVPSYDEMVNTAYKEVLFKYESVDISSGSRLRNYFYLLKKEDLGFGYLRLRDFDKKPFKETCHSLSELSEVYTDVLRSPTWKPTLPELVAAAQHKRKISGHNIDFFTLVRDKFTELFVIPQVDKPHGMRCSMCLNEMDLDNGCYLCMACGHTANNPQENSYQSYSDYTWGSSWDENF